MSYEQTFCLFLMFLVGLMGVPAIASWSDMTKGQQRLLIAWLAFWLGPPIYFVWTIGVMG